MKYEEVKDQMEYEGYEFGNLNSIDIQVCAESTCDECGHKGLKYAGFIKYSAINDISRRAWAVCPECDEAFEF